MEGGEAGLVGLVKLAHLGLGLALDLANVSHDRGGGGGILAGRVRGCDDYMLG